MSNASRRGVSLAACLLASLALAASAAPAASAGTAPRRSKKVSKTLSAEAFGVHAPGLAAASFTYEDASPLPADAVEVVVHACSLCASDVQQCRGDWGPCLLPLVPGREAVGIVAKVGAKVKDLAPGDRVAVLLGTGLDSEADDDGADRSTLDALTTGAATRRLRVPARWAFGVPLELPSQQVAGLLGAGGAVYSQLTQRRLPKGSKVGVIGGGAASALALSLADALGMDTHSVGSGPQAAASAAAAAASAEEAAPAASEEAAADEDEVDDADEEDEEGGGLSPRWRWRRRLRRRTRCRVAAPAYGLL